MKEKLIYNFLYIIPLHYLNFITVSYFVALKVLIFFVIPSDQYSKKTEILPAKLFLQLMQGHLSVLGCLP